jgi:ankyrin repeat protein
VETVRALVAMGADIEAQTFDGSRPLHVAAGYGQVEVCWALIALGCDKEAQGANQVRPLHSAAAYGQVCELSFGERYTQRLAWVQGSTCSHSPPPFS